jgi:hypothetical protein
MGRIVVAEVVFSLIVLALQKVPRDWGWISFGLVCLIIGALPALLAAGRRSVGPPSRAVGKVLVWGCLIFATAQLVFALAMLIKPKVFDIGETTLAAALAVMHGDNPYAAQIDSVAGGITDDDRFHGYKYLPMMIAVYAPLCLGLGIRGIIVTNILLQAMTAAAIRSIGTISGGRLCGLAAALLYLSLPFVAHQVFRRGVTDLASVLPLLLALRYADERPTIAGVMVGLSIATKLMPGLVLLPCALPAKGDRGHYLSGVLMGLLPILPFVVTAPDAFVANVLLFNMVRQVDDTSWLFGLSIAVAETARIVVAGILLGVTLRVWWRAPSLDQRCGLAALATLAVFAVGPGMHHNYHLWFLPLLAILGSRAALGGTVPADQSEAIYVTNRLAPKRLSD